jgi:pyruvate formate lyase activating enzyme
MKATPLGEVLARRTVEGELYEKLPSGRVRCFACGHRCLIPPGFDGICRVRFNEDGVLKVPWGYVGALQLDPVEKKPFFHALPGSRALSFGMLGCDYHCGYCFTGDTVVVTDRGPTTFAELFASCERNEARPDAELAFPEDRRVVAASGRLRRLRGVVRHRYRGELVTIRPFYLPPLRCTPDHRIHATTDPALPPILIPAKDLSPSHYLAIPRHFPAEVVPTLDAAALLRGHRITYGVRWDLPAEQRELIAVASARGETSRAIGLAIGKDASYVRHVRGKIAGGLGGATRTRGPFVRGGRVRFPGEHGSGIPVSLDLDNDLAALLGYYCAEGCVVRGKKRPNSYVLNFSFSHQELELAERVRTLLKKCLGVTGRLVLRETTLGIAVGKASAALLLKTVAGGRSSQKRVPPCIFTAGSDQIGAFLDALVDGDGHRYPGGKVAVTTVSSELAHGIALLVLRTGLLPSVHAKANHGPGTIQGRLVKRAPCRYSVVWYSNPAIARRAVQTADNHLVPLRSVEREAYDGDVYNMEVEDEHSYLAGFFAVSNCQNWVTSQALRDPSAVARPQEITPRELVRLAHEHEARIITSTYNEPLITSEWAVAVFKEARAAGLVCSYVSNGNGTPEVLDYIQPWVSLYKVDLKSFRDRHYRELGGTLERVLWTIRALHERGFWLEIVTLLIPGFNDSDEEITDIARFLVSVSPDIPWHVTAFHQDYKMTDAANTSVATLLRAAEIGAREGLRFVYAGNLPGRVGRWENTWCPGCGELLIERQGFRVLSNRVADGHCPKCARAIPGFWNASDRSRRSPSPPFPCSS